VKHHFRTCLWGCFNRWLGLESQIKLKKKKKATPMWVGIVQSINGPKRRTMNSHSLCLEMPIFSFHQITELNFQFLGLWTSGHSRHQSGNWNISSSFLTPWFCSLHIAYKSPCVYINVSVLYIYNTPTHICTHTFLVLFLWSSGYYNSPL
jgi:hypothetical protein